MSILPHSPRSSHRNFNVREVQVDDNDPTAFEFDIFGVPHPGDDRPEPPTPQPSPRRPDGPRTLFDSAKIERSDGFFIPRRATTKDGTPIAPYFVPAKPATTKPALKPQDKPQDDATTVPASVARVQLVEGSWRSEPYRRTADGWRGETSGKTLGLDVIDRAYQAGRVAILSAPAAELDLDMLLTRRPGVDEPTAEDREWNAKHVSNQRAYWVPGEYRRPMDARRLTKYESDRFQREAPRSVRRAASAGDARGRRRPAGAR